VASVASNRGPRSEERSQQGGPHGIDAFKKVSGRKRHIPVDTIGLILAVVVTAADVQDPEGAKLVYEAIRGRFSRLKLVWADGIYKQVADWVAAWRPEPSRSGWRSSSGRSRGSWCCPAAGWWK